MEEVVANIDEYIIPECQEACKELWKKNIFTFMCSNREDGDKKYILLGSMSQQNEEIFKKLMHSDSIHYDYSSYRGTYGIHAKGTEEETAKILIELTKPLEMQDVQEGYMTIEEYLISKGLYKNEIKKGNLQQPQFSDFEDFGEFLKALDEFGQSSRTIKVFDETKMTKSIEEYLLEAGELYDSERNIVYISEFYRDAHLKYLEYIENKKESTLGQLVKKALNEEIMPEDIKKVDEAQKAEVFLQDIKDEDIIDS